MVRPLLALVVVLAAGCAEPGRAPSPEPAPASARAAAALEAGPASAPEGVERVWGAGRVETAVAVSARFWRSSPAVVLATAADFPDALAAGALAAALRAPVLLTWPDHLPEAVAAEVSRLDASEAVVVGGQAAVHERVVASLRAGGLEVERVAGADRHETAAAVLSAIGPVEEVALVTGAGFADALAAAPRPVLLTARDRLSGPARAALERGLAQGVVVAGGTAAVGAAVEDEARSLVPAVRRVAGPDRYATALALLEERLAAGGEPVRILAAGGEGFADALAAGPAAALLDGAVAVVPPARLTDDLDALLRGAGVGGAALVGGPAAVGPHVESELSAALAARARPWATVTSPGGFHGTAAALDGIVRSRIAGVSYREGCPVEPDALAYLELDHVGFDGEVRRGELVVAHEVAEPLLRVLADVHDAGFPIERMRLVDDYGGDDRASMEANNTSAFNCRPVEGGSRWSEHAYGTAIDVNPVQNPYRRGSTVLPEAGRAYLDRADVRPGMIVRPGAAVEAFARIGWGWGGDWSSLDDWMHFSASAR